ncbi:DUF3159 domain-containing protein [Streptomyces sp. NPDC088116]|uniref:DUF3159 domain-containing protein n=1 Tax=Streptomyces sp. NPDC088116 TaxID=3365825 RepID=UPI003822CFB2
MTESIPPAHPAAASDESAGTPGGKGKQTPLDQMGGTTGLVYMALPVVAFVVANSAFGLTAAIGTAIGVGVAISVLRLVRKEPLQPALSGLFGVAVAAFVSWKTGSAKGFFLTGIWSNFALGLLFLLSVLVRRPLAGVVWGALNGTGTAWLKDKLSRRYYDIATLTLVGVFAVRFAVWQWLYDEDRTGWLAVAKIAMGYPLLALALLVVMWAGRRSGKRLKALAGAAQPTGAARPAAATHPAGSARPAGRF